MESRHKSRKSKYYDSDKSSDSDSETSEEEQDYKLDIRLIDVCSDEE